MLIVNYGVVASSSISHLFVYPVKIEEGYSRFLVCTAGKPAGWREGGVITMIKTISSSAAREWPICYIWKQIVTHDTQCSIF